MNQTQTQYLMNLPYTNPFLLNVQNGTVNLVTDVLQPFNKKDLLKQKLLQPENLNACLAWCVEGVKLWFAEGLDKDVPDEMAKAASAFYEESDLLQQWLDERTEPSLGFLKFSKALDDFNNWLSVGGNCHWQRKTFAEAMQLHGKIKARWGHGYGYPGLCLRT